MNFSFAGCGFLGIYHVGVASCLKQHTPHLIQNCQFAGASAGAIVACCLICDTCLGNCTTFTLRLATKARSFSLGPLHPSFKITKILRDALREVLPENAHEIASGKLHISLTRVTDRENVVVSEYSSKEELIQALMCSAHVPLYSGLVPPAFRGVRYVDGGLSDNIPALNGETVSISPFAGESDVCPSDDSANPLHIYLANTSMQCSMENLYRLSRALFPPHPEILSDMCQQGFDDTLKYLQNNNLLSCVRHLSIRSVIRQVPKDEMLKLQGKLAHESIEDVDNEHEQHEDEPDHDEHSCPECKTRRQVALRDSLPHIVGSALQEGIDDMNKGLKGLINRHRSLRLLSILATPWYLPVDISLTYALRFLQYLPHLPHDVQMMYRETADLLQYLVNNIHHKQRRYTARFSCQLAITEVNYNKIETDICPSTSHSHQPIQHQVPTNFRNLNFEFAVDLDSDLKHAHNMSIDSIPHHIENVHLRSTGDADAARKRSDSIRNLKASSPHLHRKRSDSACGRLSSTSPRLYRKQSLAEAKLPVEMVDTFEQCLHVTNQMESIMAYHYQDEDNKDCYRFEEIYTFREGDIDISTYNKQTDTCTPSAFPEEKSTTEEPARKASWGNPLKATQMKNSSHLELDIDEFVGHRSDIVLQEQDMVVVDS